MKIGSDLVLCINCQMKEEDRGWSWDLTKLLGPVKWTDFHLYVMLDIFSRQVTGWILAPRESATLAQRLIAETCAFPVGRIPHS